MKYRELGKTGRKVSILGFGAMRLPTLKPEEPAIDHEEAIRLIRKSIDAGVNYVDTAFNYHNYESEIVVGKALKDGYREKVTLATKAPVWSDDYNKPEHFNETLNKQLEKLGVKTIDVYLLHALNEKTWKKVQDLHLIESAKKAKEDGRINHLAFSFHDKPELLKEIIDSNAFEVMLVQYNILDIVNEEMIEYAAKKGLGVAIMGSVGGGRLAGEPPEELKEYLTPGKKNFADLALKYVWSNPNVSVALSGMGSEEMVVSNLEAANSEVVTLTPEQKKKANELGEKIKTLTDLLCTGCKYCEPCKQNVNISFIFRALITYQVYGQKDRAKLAYSRIGKEDWSPGENAEACIECAECLEKCPQKIDIIEQLKIAHDILTS
ncbi:MAG: aldo/keto reductase [Asgard group archaeon]|nr:aldo/keto reductase [Asgard group archaeon]